MQLTPAATAESVIHLEGVFDGPTARRVEALLTQADAGVRLQVDLTQVREFHDFAVLVLASGMRRSKARVELRGLRNHQLRLLRYFGVDVATLERATLADAL